jgi:hypothetical protein
LAIPDLKMQNVFSLAQAIAGLTDSLPQAFKHDYGILISLYLIVERER